MLKMANRPVGEEEKQKHKSPQALFSLLIYFSCSVSEAMEVGGNR